jgi:uncharacterized membrane protein YhaH (DUF805 family)
MIFRAIGENYAHMFDVRGKSTRSEYWWFVLYYLLVAVAILVGYASFVGVQGPESVLRIAFNILLVAWGVPTIISLFTAGIRRLHDIGRSGWYFLISLVPIVGPILLLISFASASTDRMEGTK